MVTLQIADAGAGPTGSHPAAAPPRPVYGAQPVGDPVLDAAAICVQRKGFDNTSLEEVAAEAGVSRTTLYRRFGSRENLFKALLSERSKPFRAWSARVLAGPGGIEYRLETVIAHAILEMQRVGWLDRSLQGGMSPASSRLFKATHAESASNALVPVLESLMTDRAQASGVTIADLLEWIAEQMIALASAASWDEAALRARLRYFMMPVLAPNGSVGEPGIAERLDAIEAKLDRLAGR